MHASLTRAVRLASTAFAVLTFTLAAGPIGAQEDGVVFDWQLGPLEAPVGSALAELEVPEGYMFLDADESKRLMEYLENPITGQEVGTVAPASENVDWFMVFEWDPIGYVPDEEGADLDSDGILQSIRDATAAANRERESRGWATMQILGWQDEPHYDSETHNLSWSIIGESDGARNVNRIVKLLGRRGVMTATLVCPPETLVVSASESEQILEGYRFVPGATYAEYIPGKDQLAQIGLSALIVGGAGAALIQTGLLARFWKLIVAVVAGLGGGLARIFGRNRDRDPARASQG